MGVNKPRVDVTERARTMLENRHAAWLDLIEELDPYVAVNTEDKWAAGQLRYALKEVRRIAKLLGLAENRKDRPAS